LFVIGARSVWAYRNLVGRQAYALLFLDYGKKDEPSILDLSETGDPKGHHCNKEKVQSASYKGASYPMKFIILNMTLKFPKR
jgi:hypothetical protein